MILDVRLTGHGPLGPMWRVLDARDGRDLSRLFPISTVPALSESARRGSVVRVSLFRRNASGSVYIDRRTDLLAKARVKVRVISMEASCQTSS